MPIRSIKLLFAVIVGCLLSSCSLTPNQNPPILEAVTELPDEFAEGEVAGSYEPLEWWKAFADPVLDQVIEAVLASNFDLAEAVARVDQARARERIVKAPAFPLLQPSLGITDTDTPTNAGIAAHLDELGVGSDIYRDFGIKLPDRIGLTTYSLGLDISYELDLWGRNRNDARAAAAERLASESDYLTARMGVRAYRVGHADTACFVAPGDDFLAQPRLLDQFLSQNGRAAYDEIPPLGERWQLIHAIHGQSFGAPRLVGRMSVA